MLIYNAEKLDGEWLFDLKLTDVEVDFLVNYSVIDLVTKGLISVQEQEEEQEVNLGSSNEHLN